MLRGLIALVLAFAIAITGMANPAYAYSDNSTAQAPIIVDNRGDNNSININSGNGYGSDPLNNPSNSFVDGLINGAATTAGFAVGGAIVCYALDGVATMFFPPASAAAAFCPTVGAAVGGTTGGIFAVAH